MPETLRATPLNALHRTAGAKMVTFGGWDMPLHYGSQIEEHHSVRRNAGVFDVSHMLAVDVLGAGARDFLRYVCANDVAKLRDAGRALYSCMLNPEGGVLDDLIVYFLAAERFRIVVNAATADLDLAWLEARRAECAPAVECVPRRDLAILAVQGPNARDKTWQALPQARAATESLAPFEAAEVAAMLVARTGYTGEDGFEIMVAAERAADLWRALRAQGVQPAGLGARDTLRLEAGMNLYGQDMDETVTPFESGLGWTVDLGSGRDFIGRAALARQAPRSQLVGLVLLERGVMRTRQPLRSPAGDGVVTSGGFAPTMQRSIALARVPLDVAPGDTVEVGIRETWMPARVVKPPFVRHGKIRVSM